MKKELLDIFIAAKWKNPEEQRGFVDSLEGATVEDIVALLDALTGRKIVVGSPEQSTRIRIFLAVAEKVPDRKLFDHYLRVIKTEDKQLRNALATLLVLTESIPQRPKICELLKSPDSNLRQTACQILRKINDPSTIRFVVEMFSSRSFPGRVEAIDLAGSLPGMHALELFKQVIASGRPPEKIKALKYLLSPAFSRGNAQSILPVIRPALEDSDESVLAEAIVVFAKLCTEEDFFDRLGNYLYHPNLRLVRAAVESLQYFQSARINATLERKLFTGPNLIRLTVLDTVERIGTSSFFTILIKGLEHKNEQVRGRASEVITRLTQSGKLQVEETIFQLIRSQDPNVKRMAVKLAADLPDKTGEVWGNVLSRVVGEDWWVRQQLVETLVEMAGNALTPLVAKYLADPSCIIRLFALDILRSLRSPDSIPDILKSARSDGEWWVRERAIEVLATINDQRTIPALLAIGTAEPEYRYVVIDALRTMAARSTAPQIASFLRDEDPGVRLASLQCLEAFDDRGQSATIVPCLHDRDLEVRQKARELARAWNIADGASGLSTAGAEALPMIDKLLIAMKNADGDDLILLSGKLPHIKRHGLVVPISRSAISSQQMQAILLPILSASQKNELRFMRDIDFSYEVKSEGIRFRANIFLSRTGISAVFRIIKGDVWKLEDLGLPPVVQSFGDFKNGLVLVGGPTGSGKSTTLSTIIEYIKRTSRRHVISIEDPIEVIHRSDAGLINQREVGVHTPSFEHALKMTLREDPDVILVGELRDLATIQFAVTAAETGHLVFGTVHTVSADATVDRLINAYPADSQEQVRSMLADSLRAVLCQYLIRRRDSDKRVLASEIMINNTAIGNLIRKGKTFQIPSVIVTSKEQSMQMMDHSLLELYKQGKISAEEAYLKARNKADFEEFVAAAPAPPAGASPAQPRPTP